MPTLRFHGVCKERIATVAPLMFDRLTALYEIPDDYLNIEIDNSVWIGRDGIKDGFPMVEILAFKRASEVEDKIALALDEILKQAGYAESEVYFIHLESRRYYSGGKHF